MGDSLPRFGAERPALDPHALALRILSEARFRTRIPPAAKTGWWDIAWKWLVDRLQGLIDAFSRNVHVGRHVSIALGDALIALAIALVAAAGIRFASNTLRDRQRSSGSEFPERRASARDLHARAVHAAESGDFAAAIALLFRSSLALLDVRRAIDDAPSHTVNECRLEIARRAPQFAAPFDSLARSFTAVAYAGVPAGEAEWASALRVYEASFLRQNDET